MPKRALAIGKSAATSMFESHCTVVVADTPAARTCQYEDGHQWPSEVIRGHQRPSESQYTIDAAKMPTYRCGEELRGKDVGEWPQRHTKEDPK